MSTMPVEIGGTWRKYREFVAAKDHAQMVEVEEVEIRSDLYSFQVLPYFY